MTNHMTNKRQAGEIAPRRRVAKGPKRPQYLQNPELDKVMMMLTALMGELSALRDRLDTHEALGERAETVTRSSVESFVLSLQEQEARSADRDRMMQRVFRILVEELEVSRSALSTRDLEQVLADDGTELPLEQRTPPPPTPANCAIGDQ